MAIIIVYFFSLTIYIEVRVWGSEESKNAIYRDHCRQISTLNSKTPETDDDRGAIFLADNWD